MEPGNPSHSTRLDILMAMIYVMGVNRDLGFSRGPKINDEVINPPQSEESKQACLRAARDKRERKRLKFLKEQEAQDARNKDRNI